MARAHHDVRCNKLYCEHLGRYFARHYRQLAAGEPSAVDFRAVRFPGLISAFTVPSGGTSDYAPEMIRATALACKSAPPTSRRTASMPYRRSSRSAGLTV